MRLTNHLFCDLLTFMHQVNSGGDMVRHEWFKYFWFCNFGLVFVLLAYYRFAKMGLTPQSTSFSRRGEQSQRHLFNLHKGNNVDTYGNLSGQYGWRFLSRGLWCEAHPFSFSQEPGHEMLRITAKARAVIFLINYSAAPGTPVLVDGPRGAFHLKARKHKISNLYRGGIGVAPFYPEIPGYEGRVVTLLYSVRSSESLAFKKISALQKQGLRVQVL